MEVKDPLLIPQVLFNCDPREQVVTTPSPVLFPHVNPLVLPKFSSSFEIKFYIFNTAQNCHNCTLMTVAFN